RPPAVSHALRSDTMIIRSDGFYDRRTGGLVDGKQHFGRRMASREFTALDLFGSLGFADPATSQCLRPAGRVPMHDYVIVGAGSAGCVLAARLSEDPRVRALVLEAGTADNKQHVRIPAAFAKLF